MALHITLPEVQAWLEPTKLTISAVDTELEAHLASEVIVQLQSAGYDTSAWLTDTTTPKLVRTIISKMVAAWIYDRQYSEDIEQGNNYADRLKKNAEALLLGLIAGDIVLPGVTAVAGVPVFYPTDASSAQEATRDDPSLGPAAFSMGMRF